jgi:hypothetical protein
MPDGRYDFIVLDPQTKLRWGVELKSTRTGNLKLDPQQVAFDVAVVKQGAGIVNSIERINGVMYRGISYGEAHAAAFQSRVLFKALETAKIPHKVESISKPR